MKADTSLVDLFLSLIKIDAVSGSEKPVADFICDYVRNLGFEAHVDDAHVLSGGNTGNVVVPVLGGGDFLLMAHMDTPRSTKGVNPLLLEDRITSDHTTILGVDDRGGISSILWALRYAVEHSMPLKPCTLLFTVCEETSLAGSCAFRPSPQITHGFVFDSHLIGIINGGTATNVVPDVVELEGEIRSDTQDEGEELMRRVITDFEKGAVEKGGSAECAWHWDFKPYRVSAGQEPYKKMVKLCGALNLKMEGVKSMGGSDANNMNAKGIPTINLGVGAENPHSTDEFILYEDLQTAAWMALKLMTEI